MVHIIIGLEPSDTRRKRKSPMDVSFLIFRSFVFRKKYTGASYRPCRRRLPHGRKYKESGECFSPASAGGKRSRRYLYSLLRGSEPSDTRRKSSKEYSTEGSGFGAF